MKSMKRILAIVMVMAMMFSLVVINASAVISTNQIDSSTPSDTLTVESGTASYNPSTNTLTLVDATISTNTVYPISTYDCDLNIVVKGTCTLTANSDSSANGINVAGNCTITGETGSKLIIKCGNNNPYSSAIYVYGDLSISGVEIEVAESTKFVYGLSSTGTITILDSKLNITAEKSCICATGDTTIKDTEATLKSEAADAIYSNSDIYFYGKDIIDMISTESYAASSDGYIVFELDPGAKVHAISEESSSLALYGDIGITINKGEITVPENGKVDTNYIVNEDEETVLEATIEVPLKDYAIAQTATELTWERGCCDILKVTSSAKYSEFANIIKVDGAVVDAKNYTAYPDSSTTPIFLTAGYLETLSVGKHTIEIVSEDGSAKGTFTIVEATKTKETTEEVAQTADNTAIGAFVALGMFAAAGVVTLKKKEN